MSEQSKVIWILRGQIMKERPEEGGLPVGDEALLHRHGAVRVTAGPLGTEVRWATFSPCFLSIIYVSELLADLPEPYMLRYFLSGWFEERFDKISGTRLRIRDIVARGDIHLMRRIFIKAFEPVVSDMPPLLRDVWIDGQADPDYSVDCVYEGSSGRFRVERIGPSSNLARLWGLAPVSYPCANGTSYGRAVSAAYADVIRSGRPHYDHVYAAMQTPDSSVIWIPYQRVILPLLRSRQQPGVSVVTEGAKVGFTIV